MSRSSGRSGPGPLRRRRRARRRRRRRPCVGAAVSGLRAARRSRRGVPPAVVADLSIAWNQLQAGNTGGADRTYARVLEGGAGTAAALAGQGYVALAREDAERAVSTFRRRPGRGAALAAALVGKGQALLELERPADALASFEAAQQADPQLALAPRIETLRFRVVEDFDWPGASACARPSDGTTRGRRTRRRTRVAGQRRALSRAGGRRTPGGTVGRGRRASGASARTGPARPGDARPARGDAGGGRRLRRRDCQLRSRSQARAVGGRGGPSWPVRASAPIWHVCPSEFQTLSTQTRSDARRSGCRAGAARARVCWRGRRRGPLPSSPTCAATGHGRGLSRRCGRASWRPIRTTRFSPPAGSLAPIWRRPSGRALGLLAGTRRPAGRVLAARGAGLRRRAQGPPGLSGGGAGHGRWRAVARRMAFGPTRPVSGQEVLDAVSRLQRLAGPLAGRDRAIDPP